MKKILTSLLIALMVVSLLTVPVLAAGKNGPAGKSNVGHLYLYEKDSADWSVVEGGAWGKYNFKLSGDGDETEVSGVFNGHNLTPEIEYSLIYYPEVAPNPWPAEGVAVIVIGSGIANDEGNVHITGTAVIGSPDDQPTVGDYVGETGDKIWLVLTSDLTDGNMTGWNPNEYLFESALINTGD